MRTSVTVAVIFSVAVVVTVCVISFDVDAVTASVTAEVEVTDHILGTATV